MGGGRRKLEPRKVSVWLCARCVEGAWFVAANTPDRCQQQCQQVLVCELPASPACSPITPPTPWFQPLPCTKPQASLTRAAVSL